MGMVASLKHQDYTARLKELGLTTPPERRPPADMQMVHKITRERDGLDLRKLFERAADSERATRITADPLNIKPKAGRLEIRRHFFTVRVTSDWNNISVDVKSKPNPAGFKKAYDRIQDGAMHPATTGARHAR
jgi:hypothetical protein